MYSPKRCHEDKKGEGQKGSGWGVCSLSHPRPRRGWPSCFLNISTWVVHTHFQVPVLETELTAPFHASIFLIDKLHAGLAYHNFTDIPHGGLVYGSLLDIPHDVLAHRSLPATQTRLLATCYWLKIILTSGSSLVLLLPWFSGISQHLFLEEVDS